MHANCLPITYSNGVEDVFEDLSCAILRPGHQWTYDVTWTNKLFGCDGYSPYGFDAMVIRGSPGLDRIEAEMGLSYIWVGLNPD